MTLCLAWKKNSKIYFASDSKLTDGKKLITDKAAKIFKLNVKVIGASKMDGEPIPEKILYRTTYGLCFTGSYLNGSLLSDSIDHILSNLQGAPEFTDFSMENLSNIAFNIYKQVSTQLMEINREKGLSRVFFGGHCLTSTKFHFFEFGFHNNGKIEFYKDEKNLTSMPLFLGDPKAIEKAKELSLNRGNKGIDYTNWHLLRDIINDDDVYTVGGDIQIGVFENNDFDTFGILEHKLEREPGKLPNVTSTFKFRGLEIDYNSLQINSGQINPSITYLNPFKKERDEMFDQIDKEIKDGNFI